jgi:hypothetical protein
MSIPNPHDPEELLDEHYAARLMSVSPRTLQSWRSEHKGPPYVKCGRLVRYRRGSLIDWVKARTQKPEG